MNWQTSVERTVTALGYEMVDCERSSHGLLRVFIDRVPGHSYPGDPAGPVPAGSGADGGGVHGPGAQGPRADGFGAEGSAAMAAEQGMDPGSDPAVGHPAAGAPAAGHPQGAAVAPGSVTLDDCERVTRQLQYALEVDGCDYARLEVSSPGLDRPLRKPADFERFADSPVDLTLKQPFQGRKKYRGTLRRAVGPQGAGFELVFQDGKEDKVLGFALDEVREARLVPVLDFKGRKAGAAAPSQGGRRPPEVPSKGAGKRGMSGGHEQ